MQTKKPTFLKIFTKEYLYFIGVIFFISLAVIFYNYYFDFVENVFTNYSTKIAYGLGTFGVLSIPAFLGTLIYAIQLHDEIHHPPSEEE